MSLSDVWVVMPTPAQIAAYTLAVLGLVVFAVLIAPRWRRLPACRFWALGTVLSLPPVCATFPMDRLLVFAGVGAMAVIALVFAEWTQGGAFALLPRARHAMVTTVVVLLALAHLVLAPVLLPLRVLTVGLVAGMGRALEASIPTDEAIRGKTLVILSSSAELTTLPPWMQRQVLVVPRPRSLRVLASRFGELRVSRLDATTLRVRPGAGLPRQRAAAHGARALAAVPPWRRDRPLGSARVGARGDRGSFLATRVSGPDLTTAPARM